MQIIKWCHFGLEKRLFKQTNIICEYSTSSHSVETPSMVDSRGIYCIEGAVVISVHSVGVQLAVSGGQPLLTLELLMFALSPEYFLSLPWGPSDIKKISFEGHKQIPQIFHVGLKPEWVFRTNIDKVENDFHLRFSSVALWCPLGSNLSNHVSGHSVTTEACTSLAGGHSVTTEACTSLARVCVVWRSKSSMELSVLWSSWFFSLLTLIFISLFWKISFGYSCSGQQKFKHNDIITVHPMTYSSSYASPPPIISHIWYPIPGAIITGLPIVMYKMWYMASRSCLISIMI